MQNKTKDDARSRIVLALVGSLAEKPSREYLVQLRKECYDWIAQIDKVLVTID